MDRKSSTMDGVSMRLYLLVGAIALAGGCVTPSAHTISRNYSTRERVPVDPPRMLSGAQDDCAAGGQLFRQYCGSCHNARPLGERPFSNYHVAMTHMRDQAYLTGKEYRQLMYFLRRWDNVGPPTPPVEPSPKSLIFSQSISELRGETTPARPPAAPPPSGPGPWQRAGAPGAAATVPPPTSGGPGAESQPPDRVLAPPLD
jgi:hypothetical protein